MCIRDRCLGTWCSGGLGSARFTVGLDDLKGLFQPIRPISNLFCDSVILWCVAGAPGQQFKDSVLRVFDGLAALKLSPPLHEGLLPHGVPPGCRSLGGHVVAVGCSPLAASCHPSPCCPRPASHPRALFSVWPAGEPSSSSFSLVGCCPAGRSLASWGCLLAWGAWPSCRPSLPIWAPPGRKQRPAAVASG